MHLGIASASSKLPKKYNKLPYYRDEMRERDRLKRLYNVETMSSKQKMYQINHHHKFKLTGEKYNTCGYNHSEPGFNQNHAHHNHQRRKATRSDFKNKDKWTNGVSQTCGNVQTRTTSTTITKNLCYPVKNRIKYNPNSFTIKGIKKQEVNIIYVPIPMAKYLLPFSMPMPMLPLYMKSHCNYPGYYF